MFTPARSRMGSLWLYRPHPFRYHRKMLLPWEPKRLVARDTGTQCEDGAEGLVFGAPVDGAGGVGLQDRGAEVVGEGPVGGAGGHVDLGHRLAAEPDGV